MKYFLMQKACLIKNVVILLVASGLLLLATSAHALTPSETLTDPVLERRAQEISAKLRCLVCQGEPISESNADFAVDLRRLVREKLAAGLDDAAVISFVQARYGDYILLDPPVSPRTYLLWVLPLAVFGMGVGAVYFYVRRQKEGGG